MRKYIIPAVILLLFTCNLHAGESVKLLAHPCAKDSILLRWAPADKESWKFGNQYGYIVERYTILRKGELTEDKERLLLTPTPLKPAPIEMWEPYEEDRYASIAAQCIFSESEIPLISATAIVKRYREEQNKFSFALYAADQSILAARLSGLYLVDKTVSPDEKYLYTVHIAAPDSIPADTAFAFTGLSEYQPLPKPIDFAVQWENQRVQLSWNILYLNHIYNSYIVEKSTDGKQYYPISDNATVQVADEGVTPEYAYRTDSLPDNRTVWYYRVRGINAFGETGPPSDSITGSGRLPITHAPVLTGKEVMGNKEVRLTWTYPEEMNEYISGFRLYRSSKPAGTKEKVYESKSPAEREFIDRHPGLTNYYALSVFNEGTEKLSANIQYAELVDSIPPHPPRGLAGKIDSTGVVLLTWNKNTDDDINGYRVYRSNRPDFEFLLVSPYMLTDTVFVDSVNINTLTKQVYYRLRAEDLRLNQSDFSEILELKRPDIIPPVAPVIQQITQQKNGLQITWFNSSSADVVRHHIYRKEANDTVFQHLTSLEKPSSKQSSYTDNSVQAGETYIYQVQAEDDSGLFSEFSSPVRQKAPGEITEQIVLKKKEEANQVILTWTIKSKKKVERVQIYKATDKEPMKLLGNSMEDIYTDNEIGLEKTYRYRIKVMYEDGTFSELSNEVSVKK
ncbi:MAG: hypothetical protein LBI82_03710 [Dysgonamonadaceae bacterium]|jgi:fibronectin type 3 domain-containing protein|nr:hypothetical protein [Dysgonamonadaceae bacterium]